MKKFFVKYLINCEGFRDTRSEKIEAPSREAVGTRLREDIGDNITILAIYEVA